eukprot:TRINITY_DN9757_c0_g1_i8.p2 TRINITY_DN9757_c0_g1~~TRINITY_DN9757_c0_g1_i8.p2  ORF type:complete len:146 (-),score=27.78 TRINITY_DN9757_c0_g1_i8:46-483(-)
MFQFNYVIGRGGFGKVWKVEKKSTKELYALKEMSKAKIISKHSKRSVLNERAILARLSHGFIINMSYAFQDRENLYLVMDLLTGGDLRYHFSKKRHFSETETSTFACQPRVLRSLCAPRTRVYPLQRDHPPVSYTHLTLPTNREV